MESNYNIDFDWIDYLSTCADFTVSQFPTTHEIVHFLLFIENSEGENWFDTEPIKRRYFGSR